MFTGLAGAAYGFSRVSLPPALPQKLTTMLTDDQGKPLANLAAEQNRQPVTISQVPQHVIDAVVSTEDRKFYKHHGIDPLGIARAAISDLLGRGSLQGASTLTQQYIKTAYLGQQRTLSRKIKEAVLALKIERQLTKQQILERYLNIIYFGRGAYGIQAAAQVYFHKDVSALTVPEGAFLAGAIRAPEYADPVNDPVTAKARRDRSLTDMVQNHKLSAADAATYKAQPVEANPYTPTDEKILVTIDPGGAPGVEYFVAYVTQKLIQSYGADVVYGGGLKVKTSLDLTMQQEAYDSMYKQVLVSPSGPAGALISVDNGGAIKAMVGGRSYATSKVNLALGNEGGGTGRQPGSTMKAVLLAEIVHEGWSVLSTFHAPPQITLKGANNRADWTVSNFGLEDFTGPDGTANITLIDATKNSVNTAYAQAVVDVTPQNTANMASKLGLGQLQPYASIVLGTQNESVMQMAGAYSVFADNGIYNQPHGILSVDDSGGTPKTLQIITRSQRLTKAETDVINYCLRQVVLSGTGVGAGFRVPIAGKTGTTENNTDAWFIGYSPEPGLTTAVWMGYPNGSQPMNYIYGTGKTGVTGGTLPADIFRRFMFQALSGYKGPDSFGPPPALTGKTLGQPAVAVFPTTTTSSTTTVPGETTTTTADQSGTTTVPPSTTVTSPPTTAKPSTAAADVRRRI